MHILSHRAKFYFCLARASYLEKPVLLHMAAWLEVTSHAWREYYGSNPIVEEAAFLVIFYTRSTRKKRRVTGTSDPAARLPQDAQTPHSFDSVLF